MLPLLPFGSLSVGCVYVSCSSVAPLPSITKKEKTHKHLTCEQLRAALSRRRHRLHPGAAQLPLLRALQALRFKLSRLSTDLKPEVRVRITVGKASTTITRVQRDQVALALSTGPGLPWLRTLLKIVALWFWLFWCLLFVLYGFSCSVMHLCSELVLFVARGAISFSLFVPVCS